MVDQTKISPDRPPLLHEQVKEWATFAEGGGVLRRGDVLRLFATIAARDAAIEQLQKRANELPGLTATLDEYLWFAGLVRGLLAEHDAKLDRFNLDTRSEALGTARVREALEALPCRGDATTWIAKRAAMLLQLASPQPIAWEVDVHSDGGAWAHAHVGSYIPRTLGGTLLPEHEFRFGLNVRRYEDADCIWEIGVPGCQFGGGKCASLEAGQEAAVAALTGLLRQALAELAALEVVAAPAGSVELKEGPTGG